MGWILTIYQGLVINSSLLCLRTIILHLILECLGKSFWGFIKMYYLIKHLFCVSLLSLRRKVSSFLGFVSLEDISILK